MENIGFDFFGEGLGISVFCNLSINNEGVVVNVFVGKSNE